MSEDKLELLAARLRGSSRITILTGAGVSAASGVPTFRGSGGLWRQSVAETLRPYSLQPRPDVGLEWARGVAS